MNFGRIFSYALLAVALTACASTAPRYYTLLPASTPESVGANTQQAAGTKFAISVQPVVLPEQVDRLQIVLSDPQSTQVSLLNSSLWASPLSDEIRNALSDELSRKLGVLDIATGSVPESLAMWKVALHVQRFESVYNERVLVDATWRLTPVNQPAKKATICRAETQVLVGEGVSAMVAGHQEALRRIAQVIAAQLSGSLGKVAVDGVLNKGCTF
jgi:uncharacterized lipoprotein YmbA